MRTSLTVFALVVALPAVAAELPAPLTDADFRAAPAEVVALGQLLFYDPVLSGNRNISCATCHHPKFATSDGVSLSLGEGGAGLGPARRPVAGDNRPEQRIPRNSQALFNLGAREFVAMFHDGRVERDPARPGGWRTPLADGTVSGVDSPLAVQALFPLISADEMSGHYGENDVSAAVRQGKVTEAWDLLVSRVRALPGYAERFVAAYPDIASVDDIAIGHIADAIAGFVAVEWRADDSPFDRHLRGDKGLLDAAATRGLALFYGPAGCAGCHSGALQTDHRFHAIAMPQLGPGKAARFESHSRDVGRMRVTGRAEDAYRFRTPSLRNVAVTPPYGHAGAYQTLEAVVRHHLDPPAALAAYDGHVILADFPEQAERDWAVARDADEMSRIASANELAPVGLSAAEVADLLAFLAALTDEASLRGRLGVPPSVPSGLPVD